VAGIPTNYGFHKMPGQDLRLDTRWDYPATFLACARTVRQQASCTRRQLLAQSFLQKYRGEYRVFDKRTGEMIPSQEPLQTGRGTSH
jgi:hypothetical protein